MQQSEEGSQDNSLAPEGLTGNGLQSTWASLLAWTAALGGVGDVRGLFCLVRFAINNFLVKGLEI